MKKKIVTPIFLTESHKKNYEEAMKAISNRQLPLDLKKVQEEITRNSR